MAEYSAKDVAALRKATGAGMMDCKHALEETDGDMDAAKDWLRAKGLAGGQARGREATRARSRCVVDGNVGALVELTARPTSSPRATFKRPSPALAKLARGQGDADLGALPFEGRPSVDDASQQLAGSSARTSWLGRVVRFETPTACSTATSTSRTSAAPSACSSSSAASTRRTPGARGRARHRAAHRVRRARVSLPRDDVPADVSSSERAVLEEQSRNEGKPEQARRRSSRQLNGFFKDVALLEQPFVKDPKMTIGKLVEGLGGDASVAPVRPGEDRRGLASDAHERVDESRASTAEWC